MGGQRTLGNNQGWNPAKEKRETGTDEREEKITFGGGGGRKRRKVKEGGHERREKTHLKVKCGVVGGECSVQLWVYLQRGGETTTTRDGCCRRGGRGRKGGRWYRKGEREPGRMGREMTNGKEGRLVATMLKCMPFPSPTYHSLAQAQRLPVQVQVCSHSDSSNHTQHWH